MVAEENESEPNMNDHVIRTGFRNVLLDPFGFPETFVLYLQEGKGWALEQDALVIDPDQGEDPSTPVGQIVAKDKWQYILEIAAMRSVNENLLEQMPNASVDTRFEAFQYFFEHDAFAAAIDLPSSQDPGDDSRAPGSGL
ncbi:MAG: hypothetical protein ACK5W4_01945 [Inhella sp.]